MFVVISINSIFVLSDGTTSMVGHSTLKRLIHDQLKHDITSAIELNQQCQEATVAQLHRCRESRFTPSRQEDHQTRTLTPVYFDTPHFLGALKRRTTLTRVFGRYLGCTGLRNRSQHRKAHKTHPYPQTPIMTLRYLYIISFIYPLPTLCCGSVIVKNDE